MFVLLPALEALGKPGKQSPVIPRRQFDLDGVAGSGLAALCR